MFLRLRVSGLSGLGFEVWVPKRRARRFRVCMWDARSERCLKGLTGLLYFFRIVQERFHGVLKGLGPWVF